MTKYILSQNIQKNAKKIFYTYFECIKKVKVSNINGYPRGTNMVAYCITVRGIARTTYYRIIDKILRIPLCSECLKELKHPNEETFFFAANTTQLRLFKQFQLIASPVLLLRVSFKEHNIIHYDQLYQRPLLNRHLIIVYIICLLATANIFIYLKSLNVIK